MLKLLAIGDVTSPAAAKALAAKLHSVRRTYQVDFIAVNAENAGNIIGPTPEIAHLLLDSGADVLTGGNHMLQNMFLHDMIENDIRVLRPANYPAAAPGFGYTILPAKALRLLVVNALGRVHMEPPLDSPFAAVERILEREAGNYDLAVLDFHAEATGEKVALARYFDSKFAAIWGTHTHVPTADLQILPGGTGYVTDLGVCGATDGILGMDAAQILKRYLTGVSSRLNAAQGEIAADAVLFTLDETTVRCTNMERIKIACSESK